MPHPHFLVRLLTLIVALGGTLMWVATPAQAADPVTVSGLVLDADTGEGIAGAYVEAYGESFDEADTGAGGGFSLSLEPGFYDVYAYADGYESGYVEVEVTEGTTTLDPIELTYLGDPVAVTGSVVDADTAAGIGGAYVEAYGPSFDDSETSPSGSYTLNLTPGLYDLYAYADGYDSGYLEIEITEDTTTLPDLELTPQVPGIYVEVYDDTFGGSVPDVRVDLTATGGALRTLVTDEDGLAVFTDVADGTYTVDVTPPAGYDNIEGPVVVDYEGGIEYVTFSIGVDLACEPAAVNANLTNMGFEDGLNGWTLGYQTETIEAIGSDAFNTPWEGASMARLGLPQPSNEENQDPGPNIMCQDFVATQAEEKFSFNFFTYDYTGFDEFNFDLVVSNPDTGETLASFRQGAFGEGTALKTSGWRGVRLDTSDNIGETLRLTFRAGGTSDDLYAFWAYLDSANTLPPTVQTTPAGVATESGSVTTNPITGLLTIAFPFSDPSDLTLTVPGACADPDAVPTSVGVALNGQVFDGALNDAGLYEVTIPESAIENATLSLQVVCDGETTVVTPLGEIVLYDPSGIITDAVTGEPVVGAEVHLYKVPSWSPQMGEPPYPANTCETNETKAPGAPWNQPAPTELGQLVNAASPEISPNVNPFVTNNVGYYGWDVAEGCYYVQVSADGYDDLVSPVVGVPSEVTDLDLELQPVPQDMTPPDTTITGGPEEGSTITTSDATFTFVGVPADDTASFECKLDGGSFAVCGSPKALSGLADGAHTFAVRAKDAAGNVDASPATRTFTVDTTPAGPSAACTQAQADLAKAEQAFKKATAKAVKAKKAVKAAKKAGKPKKVIKKLAAKASQLKKKAKAAKKVRNDARAAVVKNC